MRKLTFLGFLRNYVKQLSEQNTVSIYKLVKECAENPRLREPLFLYALETEKVELLEKAAIAESSDQLVGWAKQYDKETLHKLLDTQPNSLPANFQKVWQTYMSLSHRMETDNHTKELMRRKILSLQAQNGLSNYRLYTDLKMNPGNVNAWLKHGNSNKVSLQAARSALQYARGFSSQH